MTRSGKNMSWVIRFGFLLAGIILLALAGLFFFCSGIGMDPISVLYSGVAALLGVRLGTADVLIGAVMLTLIFFLDKKRIGIGTVAVVVGIGPLINLFLEYFSYGPQGWIGRIGSTLAGIVSFGLGMACYLHADLGCGPVDAVMLYASERTPVTLRTFKIMFDVACVLVGWAMGGALGLGTILAALLSGPCMTAFMNLLGDGKKPGKERL